MITLDPLTMTAAADFWRNKIKLGPAEFAKLSDEAKIKAFGITGIAKGDELTTVFNSLQAAIEKGISFGDFKKECADIFARRGWTGTREWRVQNIFRTNIQTAYNSGRWQKQKELADTFPYLQYNAVNDRRTRPTHKAMDGKVFPINHQFWDTWYPPNGYRCRCSTLSLTEGQIKRRGIAVETEDPTDSPVEIADPRTGAKMTVQQLLPDPGFAHHPGKVVWGGMTETKTAKTFRQMEGLAGPADFKRPALSAIRPANTALDESMLLPSGKDDLFYMEEASKRFGEELVVKDAAGEPVIMSLENFAKTAKHPAAIGIAGQALKQPYEIWLTPEQDETGRVRLAKRYVALWKTQDEKRVGGLAVFEVVDGVYRGATSFISLLNSAAELTKAEAQRRGLLLYPNRWKSKTAENGL